MHTPSGKRQRSEFELTKEMTSLLTHPNADTKVPDFDPKESQPKDWTR
jgi:hypothetical protein